MNFWINRKKKKNEVTEQSPLKFKFNNLNNFIYILYVLPLYINITYCNEYYTSCSAVSTALQLLEIIHKAKTTSSTTFTSFGIMRWWNTKIHLILQIFFILFLPLQTYLFPVGPGQFPRYKIRVLNHHAPKKNTLKWDFWKNWLLEFSWKDGKHSCHLT